MRNWQLPRPNVFASVAPTANASASFPTVKVRVLRPFYALHRPLRVGEVVSLAKPEAESAVALHRAEYA